MPSATFDRPDLSAFTRLDGLGLEVTGQRIEADHAVLACRITGEDRWCRRCGCQGEARDTVVRRLAHEPCGWRPTILHVSVRRYRCPECAHVWRQDMSQAADPRAKLSRAAVRWALTGLVVHHVTVARVGACQFFCVWGLEVGGDSVGVGGGEPREGLFPVGGGVSLDEAGVSCSLVGGFASVCEALGGSFVFDVADGEPQEFDGCFFAGEMPAVLGDFTQLVVQRFDSVGGVHDAAQHGRERQERRKSLPGALPGRGGLGVTRSQVAGRKLFERPSGGVLIGCAVDPLESGGDILAVLVGHETHGRAD